MRRQVAARGGRAAPGQGGALIERVVVGLGANLGDRISAMRSAAVELLGWGDDPVFSSVWETAPQGPVRDQPPFLNACALLRLDADPHDVMDRLLALERRLGRVRDVSQGPRAIDLDLLLYGDRQLDEPGLTVPHPRLTQRAFVLAPLAEVLGDDFRFSGSSLAELLAGVADQPVRKLDLQLLASP